jgi:hypothetical protein
VTLWRLHVRPSAEKGEDPVGVCLQKGIVGIGWRVDSAPGSKEEYWKDGKAIYGGKGWSTAANAMLFRMGIDDLVWIGRCQEFTT